MARWVGRIVGRSALAVALRLQLGLGLACALTPLCQILGYEYALVANLGVALWAPFIGLEAARSIGLGPRGLWLGIGRAVLSLAPGLMVMLGNGLRVPPCNQGLGLAFWMLMPMASAAVAAAMGWLVGAATARWSPGRAALGVALGVAASLMLMLLRLYFEPPIVLFDVLWGYFAGSLYDEAIDLPAALWAVRATTLTLLATSHAIAWALSAHTPQSRAVAWLMLGALGLHSYVIEPKWGTRIDHSHVEAALSTTCVRPGLIVHLPADIDAEEAARLADDHAYRLAQLTRRMDLTAPPVLHSYVYRDAQQKAALMGGAHTMIAKPWLGELHIHGTQTPHPLLAHEMVHVLAAQWAHGPLKVSARFGVLVNMGLTEGLAVALAPDGVGPTLRTAARTLYRMDLALPCRTLLGGAPSFWSAAPARAYTQAGALLRYLEERYGIATVAALYGISDAERVLGRSFEQLDEDLRAWLEVSQAPPAPAAAQQAAQAALRVPSIFARHCAHEVARLRAQARQAPPQEAIRLWQRAAVLSHRATTDRLGLCGALLGAGQEQAALPLLDAIADSPDEEPTARAQALVLRAQSRAQKSPTMQPQAAQDCALAVRLAANRGIDRQAWATAWANAQPPPLRWPLLAFLAGTLPEPQAQAALAALPHDRTAQYLAGRLAFARGAYAQALQHLDGAGPHPYEPLEAQRLQLLALAAFRLGRDDDARRAARRLADEDPQNLFGPWAEDLLLRIEAHAAAAPKDF